jgi:hypothetical protein
MSNNYTLGRGEVHFGQFKTDTQIPRGERYFGNTPELSYSAEQETLDHFNSDRGVRTKDESIPLQIDYSGSFITDNISPENLAAFFMGNAMVLTDAGSSVVAESHTAVEPGLSYQLGTSSANPSGVRKVSAVVVKDDGATTYVVDTDYTVDLDLGRVTVVAGGAIVDGTNLLIDYTIDPSSRDLVVSKSTVVEGSLRFLAYNPAGKQIDYFMPWVKITPSGDFALKGDEWQQLPFTLEILKKGSLEAVYMDGRPYV